MKKFKKFQDWLDQIEEPHPELRAYLERSIRLKSYGHKEIYANRFSKIQAVGMIESGYVIAYKIQGDRRELYRVWKPLDWVYLPQYSLNKQLEQFEWVSFGHTKIWEIALTHLDILVKAFPQIQTYFLYVNRLKFQELEDFQRWRNETNVPKRMEEFKAQHKELFSLLTNQEGADLMGISVRWFITQKNKMKGK